MSYSKLILRDSAEIVWPLDDVTESSSISKSINFFTNNPASYSASININNTNLFYTPIIFGGGTLLSFTSSAIGLSIPAINRFSELYNNKSSVISFWFQTDILPTIESPVFKKRGSDNIGLFIKNNYLIFKCGTSASYNEISADIVDVKDPHHVILSRSKNGLTMILDGISYTTSNITTIELEKDNNHLSNDYLDFYGPIGGGSWNIDSIALYQNTIDPNIAKRHYVYGLGKNISDKFFYSRGGNLYNFSTIYTEKLYDINWDYPEEWKLNNLVDLNNDINGIGPLKFSEPTIYSYDNYLDTNNNKYKFSSSTNNTQASYIQIDSFVNKINELSHPFLVKFKLDGPLPSKYLSQRLISIGRLADEEIIKFDLYNDNDNYQIKISAINTSASISFNINNISSSPSFYIGMKFDEESVFIFSESGSAIQTKKFNYLSASGFGLDPLVGNIPFPSNTLIRLGSSLNYDETSYNSNVYGVNQFLGSFQRFLVTQPEFSTSANFSYIENYNKSKYEFSYKTDIKRFKIKTYGYGNFNIHSVQFSEFIDDNEQKIGSNQIQIGYPDIQSSSNVLFYVSLISYSGSVISGPTLLSQNNYLNYLNNINLLETYLKFDFEINSDDAFYYPPRIKYFKMQTFKSSNNKTILKDDAGPSVTLHPSSSSAIYLPEIKYTPTIFLTSNSGIKLYKNYIDFTENIIPKPLDPQTISGLILWLDSRFINGFNKTNPSDDSRVLFWKDLSENNNSAYQSISASAPVYRAQSLNLLRMNQLDGGELDQTEFINPINSSILTSIDGAVSGLRGIEITPNQTSIDSYIDVSFNTASITVFPNQSYSIVGSIKLLKPQTASALHSNARKIIVYTTDGITEILSASSVSASNTAGVYSLSAIFTTSSAITGARLRFYNGSYDNSDKIYWDNLGLYPISSGSALTSWVQPLTTFDRPTIKFDGIRTFLQSSASVSQPYSLYMVGRIFGDGTFINSTASSSFYNMSGSYYLNNGTAAQMLPSDNEFNVYSIIVDSGSARLYVNGEISSNKISVGSQSLSNLLIGSGNKMLAGDISSILLFSGKHNYITRTSIENWLDESFNLPEIIESIDAGQDNYLLEYTLEY